MKKTTLKELIPNDQQLIMSEIIKTDKLLTDINERLNSHLTDMFPEGNEVVRLDISYGIRIMQGVLEYLAHENRKRGNYEKNN